MSAPPPFCNPFIRLNKNDILGSLSSMDKLKMAYPSDFIENGLKQSAVQGNYSPKIEIEGNDQAAIYIDSRLTIACGAANSADFSVVNKRDLIRWHSGNPSPAVTAMELYSRVRGLFPSEGWTLHLKSTKMEDFKHIIEHDLFKYCNVLVYEGEFDQSTLEYIQSKQAPNRKVVKSPESTRQP